MGFVSMEIHDYNGTGRWAAGAILDRYHQYCRQLKVEPRSIRPREHTEGKRRWVYPLMNEIIEGIEEGDPACRRIGIEFIQEDQSFSFGRTLKSNTARALRRATLTPDEMQKVRARVVAMLLKGYIPREFRQYAKLLKKIGLAEFRAQLSQIDETNPYVMKYYLYLSGP